MLLLPFACRGLLEHRRRAQIHERRGEVAAALEHYAQFVEMWREADPDLQPLVSAARARVEVLARRSG